MMSLQDGGSRWAREPARAANSVLVVTVMMAAATLDLPGRLKAAKQTVALAIRSSGKVKRPRNPSFRAIPKGQRPESIDNQHSLMSIPEQTLKPAVVIE